MIRYERIIRRALQHPWCVTEEMYHTIREVLHVRATGGRLSDEELLERIGFEPTPPAEPQLVAPRGSPTALGDGNKIALIPVHGVLAHRSFEASSGATSVEFIQTALRQALADPDVGAILLDISSPGGSSEGVPELAREIFKAREQKPIVAHANGLAASAAFWIGTQATEFFALESGDVGSLGVFSLHEDWTGWLENEGIKITMFRFGERKIEGAPWEALDQSATEFFQSRVDEIGTEFVRAVAKGRGITTAKVRSDFGGGRLFGSREAKARNMIDGVMTRDKVVDRLARLMTRNRRSASRRRAEGDGIGRLVSVLIGGAAAHVDDPLLSNATTPPAVIDDLSAGESAAEDATAMARRAQVDRDYLDATIAMTARHAV